MVSVALLLSHQFYPFAEMAAINRFYRVFFHPGVFDLLVVVFDSVGAVDFVDIVVGPIPDIVPADAFDYI